MPELRAEVGALTPRLEKLIHTLEWIAPGTHLAASARRLGTRSNPCQDLIRNHVDQIHAGVDDHNRRSEKYSSSNQEPENTWPHIDRIRVTHRQWIGQEKELPTASITIVAIRKPTTIRAGRNRTCTSTRSRC